MNIILQFLQALLTQVNKLNGIEKRVAKLEKEVAELKSELAELATHIPGKATRFKVVIREH